MLLNVFFFLSQSISSLYSVVIPAWCLGAQSSPETHLPSSDGALILCLHSGQVPNCWKTLEAHWLHKHRWPQGRVILACFSMHTTQPLPSPVIKTGITTLTLKESSLWLKMCTTLKSVAVVWLKGLILTFVHVKTGDAFITASTEARDIRCQTVVAVNIR